MSQTIGGPPPFNALKKNGGLVSSRIDFYPIWAGKPIEPPRSLIRRLQRIGRDPLFIKYTRDGKLSVYNNGHEAGVAQLKTCRIRQKWLWPEHGLVTGSIRPSRKFRGTRATGE